MFKRISELIFDLLHISVFFWLTSFLYLFLLGNLYFSNTYDEKGTLIITIFLFVPLILSPSLLSVFDYYRKLSKYQYSFSFKQYISIYWENYLLGLLHGLVYMGIFLVLYAGYIFYGNFSIFGRIIPFSFMILLNLIFLFVLSYTSYFEEKLLVYWKNSLFLCGKHFFLFFILSVEVIGVVMVAGLIGFGLYLLVPGIIIIIVTYFYKEIIKRERRE
ncbi:DUF624 domain-containing protein [Enterococcus casseliflavus]|jgi:uncharacterized membrane protein YesL|uniref:DUF624 domain-containing protein n=1 Tax=Enterococcus casseliflavus TaxID=37734 RepID=UPI001E626F6F|nr:DUF624 domain-containing protein [Enterococcus casseliflavus]MCD4963833.1 DUF624 domain-containing protein [Enterococcus casseliflavus]